MRVPILLGFVALLAGTSLSAAPFEIGEALGDESFWASDSVLFVNRHQEEHGFKFMSEDRTSADSRREGGVTCFGIPVYESRVSFGAEGGIERVELMLFNRGGTESVEEIRTADGKRMRRLVRNESKMSREDFFRTLSGVRTKLTKPGGKPPAPVDERTAGSSVRQRVQTWPKTDVPTVASLLWNYSQEGKKTETFRPGFIRLSVDGPSRVATVRRSAPARSPRGAKKLSDNVVRDTRGDVFIGNVPMVDQGAKGYCSVATAERVMRYYGLEVDEHEMAEVAGTEAEKGTETSAMKASIERIGGRYGLGKPSVLYGDFNDDVQTRIANLDKEVAAYNKAAKKFRRKAISEDVYVTRQGNMVSYDPQAVDEAMDPEVLKYMKTDGGQKSKFTKFKKDVHQYVDAGMPLYWGVTLGLYPEDDLPQKKGGHMRLVIGYNDKGGGELIYTDSWGKGHERKRMPIGWAWTITRCLMVTKPSK